MQLQRRPEQSEQYLASPHVVMNSIYRNSVRRHSYSVSCEIWRTAKFGATRNYRDADDGRKETEYAKIIG